MTADEVDTNKRAIQPTREQWKIVQILTICCTGLDSTLLSKPLVWNNDSDCFVFPSIRKKIRCCMCMHTKKDLKVTQLDLNLKRSNIHGHYRVKKVERVLSEETRKRKREQQSKIPYTSQCWTDKNSGVS